MILFTYAVIGNTNNIRNRRQFRKCEMFKKKKTFLFCFTSVSYAFIPLQVFLILLVIL